LGFVHYLWKRKINYYPIRYMWSVVSNGFEAGLLSLLELQTFRLKENNVTNTKILKTLFYFI